jgi:hypothetical protein
LLILLLPFCLPPGFRAKSRDITCQESSIVVPMLCPAVAPTQHGPALQCNAPSS